MVYSGRIKNGVVVFDEKVTLEDGTPVRIETVERTTLAERFKDVIGKAPELPANMAEQHDQYIQFARAIRGEKIVE